MGGLEDYKDCPDCKNLTARAMSLGRIYAKAIRELWTGKRLDAHGPPANLIAAADIALQNYKKSEGDLKKHLCDH